MTETKLLKSGLKTTKKDQLGQADWINAAKKILIKHGITEVKIEKIATKLKVTVGSFYWHFSGRPALYDALIENWLTTNTKPLAQAVKSAGDDPRRQYLAFFGVWVLERNFDPSYDTAVRMWSRSSPKIGAIVALVDAERIEILVGIYLRFGYLGEEARMRARVTYYHQVGYYAMNIHEPTAERISLAPDYAKILVGFDWMADLRGTDKVRRAMRGEDIGYPDGGWVAKSD